MKLHNNNDYRYLKTEMDKSLSEEASSGWEIVDLSEISEINRRAVAGTSGEIPGDRLLLAFRMRKKLRFDSKL